MNRISVRSTDGASLRRADIILPQAAWDSKPHARCLPRDAEKALKNEPNVRSVGASEGRTLETGGFALGDAARVELSCYGVEMREGLVDGERAHFLSEAVAGFERPLEIVPGNFDGESIGDHLSRALVVFDPGGMRQSDPDGA